MAATENLLYYGDNLTVLREHIEDESVDLVYLDPPFNSNADYNVLFREHDGTQAAAQIRAFDDTWQWDASAAAQYHSVVSAGGPVSRTMRAFYEMLSTSNMMAYLAMMAPRLLELKRVLKPTGSLYLHCDPTASHYLKLLLDATFDAENFRNEIIWRRTGAHNSARRYGPIHDSILFYSKGKEYKWNRVLRPYLKGHVESYFKKSDQRGRYWSNSVHGAGRRGGESGLPWRGFDVDAHGRHWAVPSVIVEELGIDDRLSVHEKLDALYAAGVIDLPTSGDSLPTYRQYLDTSRGVPLQDVWSCQPHSSGLLVGTTEEIDADVKWLEKRGGTERLGYPTQKPVGLLARIIESSSDPGDIILDPFCGCGTTIAAAQQLERRWIGIDITHLAIGLIRKRLTDAYGPSIPFTVVGEPVSLEDARQLAKEDKFQFQAWALGLVGARPSGGVKKGADKGVDGRLIYANGLGSGKTDQIVISVKGGQLKPDDVRALEGVRARERAAIGVLISMEAPSKKMKADAASYPEHATPWGNFQRIQILTVEELLDGKRIAYPSITGGNVTLKAARKVATKTGKQGDLFA